MNIRYFMTGFAALTITVSSNAFADEIYKWIDEEGNVHYEDRPSGASSEERLKFSYNRTNASAVQKRVQTQRDAAAARREARDAAADEKVTAAEAREAAEARAARCKKYRASMKTMLESRRVYRENEAGEREYLDDAARTEARAKAEELIEENCSD